jgi:hypothetical protein
MLYSIPFLLLELDENVPLTIPFRQKNNEICAPLHTLKKKNYSTSFSKVKEGALILSA